MTEQHSFEGGVIGARVQADGLVGVLVLDERQGFRRPVGHLRDPSPAAVRAALKERALRRLATLVESPSRAQQKRWLEERGRAFSTGRPVEAVVVEVRREGPSGPGAVIEIGRAHV